LIVRFVAIIAGIACVSGCQPTTSRPPFPPKPEAAGSEIRLSVPEATRRLAETLKADSFVIRKVNPRDGYIETSWFQAANGRPTRHSSLGPSVVRIRAWADPARPGSSQLTIETLYRPKADPSLPERELERQVGRDHPVALKVEAALKQLVDRYGGAPGPQQQVDTAAATPEDAGDAD
jgi:hypothetical protein